MCGMCGIWYNDPRRQVQPTLLEQMPEQIAHRGPDDTRIKQIGSLGLGFRRLSIIDVVGRPQPMSHADEHIWLTLNGEIYNLQAFRRRLGGNHTSRTSGDPKTIIHAYDARGADSLQHFQGIYAFLISDRAKDLIFRAVDRFGKKPFHYLPDYEKLINASVIKSILPYPGLDLSLDYDALDEYPTNGYVSVPNTVFKHIRKLPPGHF